MVRRLVSATSALIKSGTQSRQDVVKYIPRRLPPLLNISDLLKVYRVRARSHLSQNFLLNKRLCDKIVRLAGVREGDYVLEIGPGPGNITRQILECGPAKLYVIEKDRRFMPLLEMLADAAQPGQMNIMLGDAMDQTFEGLFPEEAGRAWDDDPPRIMIIGNLPFNVSTPLVIRLLRQIHSRTGIFRLGRAKMVLTFQEELAQRMVARIVTRDYTRLSIMCQNWCHVSHSLTISGKSFSPAPQVDVGVVKFTPRVRPLIEGLTFDVIERCVRTVFNYRNKELRNASKFLFPKDKREECVRHLLTTADLDPSLPPFTLSIEEWGRMIKIYHQMCLDDPSLDIYEQAPGKPKRLKELFKDKR